MHLEADPGVYTMEEFAIMSEMEAEGNTWTTFTTDIWVQRKLNAIRANYGGIISFHDPVTGYFQVRSGGERSNWSWPAMVRWCATVGCAWQRGNGSVNGSVFEF